MKVLRIRPSHSGMMCMTPSLAILLHHDTNNEELDPDNWVAVQGPFKVLWRSLITPKENGPGGESPGPMVVI